MASLRMTNMTAEEMIPDTENPAHDPRYWCLPPVRDEVIAGGHGGHQMYLVTQGRKVGVWHNWTLAKAMVDGYPSAAQRGHATWGGCVAEWQQHCSLGIHPHPAAPANPRTPAHGTLSSTKATPTAAPSRIRRRVEEPAIEHLLDFAALSVSDESSVSTSSVTTESWDDVPPTAHYFALWGGRIVYTDRGYARLAFLKAERDGKKPRILSTANYQEAQAFGESVLWI